MVREISVVIAIETSKKNYTADQINKHTAAKKVK